MYKFHDEKVLYATSFTIKISPQKVPRTKINFTRRKNNAQGSRSEESTSFAIQKISRQQVPRTKISTQQFPWAKSISQGEKSMNKFHKDKNQHATSSMNKISFTRRKINVQVSRKKIAFNRCHDWYHFYKDINKWTSFKKTKTVIQRVPCECLFFQYKIRSKFYN